MNKEKLLDENSKHALQSDNIIAITNRHLCSRPFMEQLERVCKLHPHAIVLREKDMPEAEYLSLARDVIALCKKYDVQCMLHSFINVAMELEHPYIHLPLPILEAYVKKNVSGNISTGMSKALNISSKKSSVNFSSSFVSKAYSHTANASHQFSALNNEAGVYCGNHTLAGCPDALILADNSPNFSFKVFMI